jgi:hypothetical protein
MEIKKALFKTIVCLSTVFLLAACDDDSETPQVSVTPETLNCSPINDVYTVTEVIPGEGDEEDTTETTTIDVGSNCAFNMHSDTLGDASGTLTANNGRTYTGTGTSTIFCGGAFDFSLIVDDTTVSYVLRCK